ncbi:MAG TPA: hypothetical protein PK309_07900 [Bacillota bacterium]|nr:hypothetical protein [Bacillota bacterium]HQD86988.1 hypothetical protein [Bacillota bacterium]
MAIETVVMQWKPEQLWEGADVFIIGGGPSLRSFDWTKLIGRKTIGCNDAFRLGPDVCAACIFGDLRWFNVHRKALQEFPNPVYTNQPSLHDGKGVPWLRTLPRKPKGLHKDALGWGCNTGCSAINLALLLGARRVFLLGFDMQVLDGKTNWHDANISKPTDATYKNYQKGFAAIAKDLPVVFPGCCVYNCGKESRLQVFPKVDLEAALCGVISPVCG